jgi:hypothetical protein
MNISFLLIAQYHPNESFFSQSFINNPKKRKKDQPVLRNRSMERVMGIEPTPQAWEAGVLPLNYTRRISRTKSYDSTAVSLKAI